MRKKIILVLTVVGAITLASCEKEQVIPTQEQSTEQEVNTKKGGATVMDPSTAVSVYSLNLCGNHLSTLGTITNSSGWGVGSAGVPGYIDYELDEAFRCAYDFATCHIRFPGPPLSIEQVEFTLIDEGVEVFDPVNGFVTEYLLADSGISAATAEQLKEHFACVIKEYQNSNFSGYTSYINNVSFHGDILLCTCPSGNSRYLKATATFYLY